MLADDRLTGLPLFGLGICFGAGPMVRAVAEDARFRAFAGVAGVYTDSARTKAMLGDAYEAAIDRGTHVALDGRGLIHPGGGARRRRRRDAAEGGV